MLIVGDFDRSTSKRNFQWLSLTARPLILQAQIVSEKQWTTAKKIKILD